MIVAIDQCGVIMFVLCEGVWLTCVDYVSNVFIYEHGPYDL
jgi:hypothetical protein